MMELEFELPAYQYQLMGYAGLKQGEPLSVTLETDILVPDPAASGWFAVQQGAWPDRFERIAPATYAFAGRISAAELLKEGGSETATLLVQCGEIPLRVSCTADESGRLPFGTWETRYLAGVSRLHGLVEDDFHTAIGRSVDVTIWDIQRLVLTPGDAVFGQWYETDRLMPAPYHHDRIVIRCRLHRNRLA
ncbi:MAG: hypothetical protein KF832_11350 [Caldilineaceae bacterium]|nr:hypothetical protein [Caldilineaceae bacterium]